MIWPDLSTDQPVLEVGPESVGASPGPACYGLGGEIGRRSPTLSGNRMIDPGRFLGGTMQLYPRPGHRGPR